MPPVSIITDSISGNISIFRWFSHIFMIKSFRGLRNKITSWSCYSRRWLHINGIESMRDLANIEPPKWIETWNPTQNVSKTVIRVFCERFLPCDFVRALSFFLIDFFFSKWANKTWSNAKHTLISNGAI